MTLLLSGRRLPTPRPPFSLSCFSGLSSDRHLRVPPTGIPRPDQEEAPAGSGRPLRHAAGVALVAFAMMAGQGSAGASADTGIVWQFAPLVEGGHEPRAALIAARARHQQETGAARRCAAGAGGADLAGGL